MIAFYNCASNSQCLFILSDSMFVFGLCVLFDFLIFGTIIARRNIFKKKYVNAYIKFEIITIVIDREIRPQCAMCAVVLRNDTFKPVKLER